jgi:hypothetical protein
VSDVYDGLANFYNRVEEGEVALAERASAVRKWTVVTPTVSSVGFVNYARYTQRKAVCKTGIIYWVDSSQLANLQDWGITNPLLLAWELLPYSFVVDWFIPVGDWLATVDYSLGLSFKEGFESYMTTAESMRVYKPKPHATIQRTVSGTDTFGEATFRRVKLTSFPSAPFKSVDKNGLRGKRIANALALLGVAFGRKTKRR